MIYQHRIVIARSGRLEKRHAQFQSTTMSELDAAGSVLVGAFEVYIGSEAGSAVWQIRQFDSMAAWAEHQSRIRADTALSEARQTRLYPHLDEVDTSMLMLTDISPELPTRWPAIDAVRGQPRGWIEQRILRFAPGTTAAHHAFYKEHLMDALDRDGSRLIGLFDTIIGEGTSNGYSMRSVELRHFPDLAAWQRWREAQDEDPELAELVKARWLPLVAEVHSTLLRPLDYSRIR
ncbi:MAG: NIPSNAP family protein [Gammaproteobacteria bacterium]|nr:NIPSNAP family protein [Gammaproteobacteria bacterium]